MMEANVSIDEAANEKRIATKEQEALPVVAGVERTEITIEYKEFKLRITGRAADRIAVAGSFAVAGYVLYKAFGSSPAMLLSPPALGSIIVDVAVRADKADKFLHECLNGQFLERMNETLNECPKQEGKVIDGRFEKIDVEQDETKVTSSNGFQAMERKSNKLKKEYNEKVFKLRLSQQESMEEEEATTTTETKITKTTIRKKVKRNREMEIEMKHAGDDKTSTRKLTSPSSFSEAPCENDQSPSCNKTRKSSVDSVFEQFEESNQPKATSSANMNLDGTTDVETQIKQKSERCYTVHKPSLQETFPFKDASSLVKNGDFEAAYGILSQQYDKPVIAEASFLLQYHKVLVKTERFGETQEIVKKLTSLFKDRIQTSAQDCKEMGDQFRKIKRYSDSLLLYRISVELVEVDPDSKNVLTGLSDNMRGMQLLVKELMLSNQSNKSDKLKALVSNHVIPILRRVLEKFSRIECDDRKHLIYQEAYAVHYFEQSLCLIEEWKQCEPILVKAISRLKHVYGDEVASYGVYGTSLHNLGKAYFKSEKYEESVHYFKLAVEAFEKATDYTQEKIKEKEIQTTKNNLQIAESKVYGKQ